MDEVREKREELRRLIARLFVAVLLTIFAEYCKLQGGLDLSETEKTIHVSLYWASKLNKLSRMCFPMVFFGIWSLILDMAFAPVAVERMRRRRKDSDVTLVFASIFLFVSLSLSWLIFAGSSSCEFSVFFPIMANDYVQSL